MYDSIQSLPAGWDATGQAYALISDGTGIDGIVSFEIPETYISSGTTGKLFIAEYSDGQWTALDSVISGEKITAYISGEGTFALMSSKESVEGASTPSQTEKQSAGTPVLVCLIVACFAVAISLKIKK